MATKAAKTTKKSKRGGTRAGAGRKPKAVNEMREVLIPATVARAATGSKRSAAAEFALLLFEATMRDEAKALDLRLDCAKEVLNRTIGKPRIAEPQKNDEEATEQVHIYLPDNGRDARTG